MKLSQQLEAMAARRIELGLYQQAELICAAAAVVKAVESAPVGVLRFDYLSEGLAAGEFRASPPADGDFEKFRAIEDGQRVALVPLPQQSET